MGITRTDIDGYDEPFGRFGCSLGMILSRPLIQELLTGLRRPGKMDRRRGI